MNRYVSIHDLWKGNHKDRISRETAYRQSRIPRRAVGDVNSGPRTDSVCTSLQRSSSWLTAFLCVK